MLAKSTKLGHGTKLGPTLCCPAAFGRAGWSNYQGAARTAAALSFAADRARLHVVEHGTEAAPTARAAPGPRRRWKSEAFVGTM